MSFKINKNTGKVGEFIPVDFSKTEPIFDEDISIERPGLYKFVNGDLVLTDGNEVYVYQKFKTE